MSYDENWKFCYDVMLLGNSTDTYYYDAKVECFCNDNCPSSVSQPLYLIDYVSNGIYAFVAPVVFTFGIMGNILILLMFQTKELKNMPSKPLFEALAVYDIFALVSGYFFKFFEKGYDIFLLSTSTGCKLQTFFQYSSLTASAWVISALTVDRFICILKANMIRWKHRLWGIVIMSILVAILGSYFLYTVVFWYTDDYTIDCLYDVGESDALYTFHFYYMPWIDVVGSFVLPSVIIIICNIGMIYNMKKSESADVSNRSTSSPSPSGVKASKRLTCLFIIMSSMFILMVLPLNAWFMNYNNTDFLIDEHFNLVGAIVKNLYFWNNAMRFLIYCIGWPKFRQAFKSMIRSVRCKSDGVLQTGPLGVE